MNCCSLSCSLGVGFVLRQIDRILVLVLWWSTPLALPMPMLPLSFPACTHPGTSRYGLGSVNAGTTCSAAPPLVHCCRPP